MNFTRTFFYKLLLPHVILLVTDVSCGVSSDTPTVDVLTSCCAFVNNCSLHVFCLVAIFLSKSILCFRLEIVPIEWRGGSNIPYKFILKSSYKAEQTNNCKLIGILS